MLFDFIRSIQAGTVDFIEVLIYIIVALMIIFLVMPFHEWAHAFTAYKLGDTSVKYRKRLTLNPLEHIDPVGALMIILLGFGWAKPVPINDRNFKNAKVGMGITALAGPVANLVAALLGGLIYNAILAFAPIGFYSGFGEYVLYFFFIYVQLNITLAVFNLIPIPPLDGSKILFMFLPDKWVYTLYKYENLFFVAIFALVWLDILPIGYISGALFSFVDWLTALPFVAFI
ncbi:MAG: site-2 protease family protein [Ruminococcus sp.]|nr:site-2 protease family protein [Ruminococcus sp.]